MQNERQSGSRLVLVSALKDMKDNAAEDDVREHNQQQNQRHRPWHPHVDDTRMLAIQLTIDLCGLYTVHSRHMHTPWGLTVHAQV